MISASVAIGKTGQPEIEGYAIELRTPNGVIQVGIDNDGRTYVSSTRGPIHLHPQSSNRFHISVENKGYD